MEQKIKDIARHFILKGDADRIVPFGNGHINDTYLVTTQADDTSASYILQRINTSVFHNPETLMENIIGITEYLKKKIAGTGGDPRRQTLSVIPTRDHKSFYRDADGSCYRVYDYIADTSSLDRIREPQDFYAAAEAFGNFQYLLSDYPAGTLHEVIPDFHNTQKRYHDFLAALGADRAGRAAEVKTEISFLEKHREEMPVLHDLLQERKIPLRVTHNDTKLNNILLDNATGKGICIIDLDTVMPGTPLYDFGDSIRFGASTADEDERDLSRVSMDLTLFECYTEGYIGGCRGTLTATERTLLPMGAKIMTLECGMRFLTDYLEGDVYFKIHRPEQNLDRCRTQFALVADMEKKWKQMNDIIRKYS